MTPERLAELRTNIVAVTRAAFLELLDGIYRLTTERDALRAALRAALREHAPGCRWPGCTRTATGLCVEDGLLRCYCDKHRDDSGLDIPHAGVLRTLNKESER